MCLCGGVCVCVCVHDLGFAYAFVCLFFFVSLQLSSLSSSSASDRAKYEASIEEQTRLSRLISQLKNELAEAEGRVSAFLTSFCLCFHGYYKFIVTVFRFFQKKIK